MTDQTERRDRSISATDVEWEYICERARNNGTDVSRYIIRKATETDIVPASVVRRVVREILILAKIEESRLESLGAASVYAATCDAIDDWLEQEDRISRLTDPGAANRWKNTSLELFERL